MMDWIIKKAELQDSSAIIRLLKESFSGHWSASQSIYSQEFWSWLYRDNPGGGSITFVAESQGKVVGHFPNVLACLKMGNSLCLAGIVLHLTTHPDYRRKGIFKNLGKASLEELIRSNIPYSFAFPNDKSRPGFINKLGFSSIVTLPLLVKPLRIKNILTIITKRPILGRLFSLLLSPLYYIFSYNHKLQRENKYLKIESKEHFGPEFDSFWKRSMSQAKVMVQRDARFLNWRFNLRPKQSYQTLIALRNNELVGYIVTRKAKLFSLQIGIIMDYLVLPGEADIFQTLLSGVLDSFKKEGLDLCIAACLKNNIYYKTLKNVGFIYIPPRFNPRKLVLVGRVNQDTAGKETFLDKKNWFISFGDWDVF